MTFVVVFFTLLTKNKVFDQNATFNSTYILCGEIYTFNEHSFIKEWMTYINSGGPY